MLALSTTQVHVQGRSAAPPQTDTHGALLPAVGVARGPYAAHRRMTTPAELDTDPNTQQQRATWYLTPDAWPLQVGDTIHDLQDATTWRVQVVDLVPAGLGLQQVQADCTRHDLRGSTGWVILEGDPAPADGPEWQVGHGPPPADFPGDVGALYLDLDTLTFYRKVG